MISEILTKVKKYAPSYWPLQSFIATNPLFNIIEEPLDTCLSKLGRYIDINVLYEWSNNSKQPRGCFKRVFVR